MVEVGLIPFDIISIINFIFTKYWTFVQSITAGNPLMIGIIIILTVAIIGMFLDYLTHRFIGMTSETIMKTVSGNMIWLVVFVTILVFLILIGV